MLQSLGYPYISGRIEYFSVKPKTEEFLNLLLWTAEQLMRPTFRNLNESYEGWAYRNGLLRQVSKLEKQQLVQRDRAALDDRVYRLTSEGRLHALGGRDPEARWSRIWDGSWRLVLFDVPITHSRERIQLWRQLRRKQFGYLQNSVWITPDPLEKERQLLRGSEINVESLILMEARPCARESDAQIVAAAWDFKRINRLYNEYLEVLRERPTRALHNDAAAKTMLRWAQAERAAWLKAVGSDPLLPEKLLPSGYQGKKAWRKRIGVLRQAGRHLRTFEP